MRKVSDVSWICAFWIHRNTALTGIILHETLCMTRTIRTFEFLVRRCQCKRIWKIAKLCDDSFRSVRHFITHKKRRCKILNMKVEWSCRGSRVMRDQRCGKPNKQVPWWVVCTCTRYDWLLLNVMSHWLHLYRKPTQQEIPQPSRLFYEKWTAVGGYEPKRERERRRFATIRAAKVRRTSIRCSVRRHVTLSRRKENS